MSGADVAAFAAFELAFVVGPGVLVHRALVPAQVGALERLCVGAATGHALTLLAFMATAAADRRGMFALLPVVVAAAALMAIRRDSRTVAPVEWPRFNPAQLGAAGAVVSAALLLFAAAGLSQVPLPESEPSVAWYPDLPWGMAFAADALHHWPLSTPQVTGEPARYHTFVFMQMAATAQVTGISLPVVVLWLVPTALIALVGVQLVWAGRRLTGTAWAGPVAAALLLLVGDLDLGSARPEPFVGMYFTVLFLSPTHLLGLVFFIPAIVLIRDMLEADGRPAPTTCVLLGLLLFGAAGAKASILPVLGGGMVLYGLWRRRLEPGWVIPLALVSVASVLSYVLVYSGGRGASSFGFLQSSLVSFVGRPLAASAGDGGLGALGAYALATLATALALMAPLLGLLWLARDRSARPTLVWALSLLAASGAAFFLLDLPGASQFYFLWYGYTAAALVAAGGIVKALTGMSAWPRWVLLAAGAVGLTLAIAPSAGPLTPGLYFAALLALAAVPLVWRTRGKLPEWAAAAAVVSLLAAGALDGALDRLPGLAKRALAADQPVHRPAGEDGLKGITRELAAGLRWVRDHSGEDAVVAVNNHFLIDAVRDSRFFYYAALTERRVYLESWDYTDRAFEIGQVRVRSGQVPFPRRLWVNEQAQTGSAAALAQLRSAGVDYFLADAVNGPPTRRLGTVVFRNSALTVYRL